MVFLCKSVSHNGVHCKSVSFSGIPCKLVNIYCIIVPYKLVNCSGVHSKSVLHWCTFLNQCLGEVYIVNWCFVVVDLK